MLHVFTQTGGQYWLQHRSVIYRGLRGRKKLLWCNSAPICGISVFQEEQPHEFTDRASISFRRYHIETPQENDS